MAFKPKIEKRVLQKTLYETKKKPPIHITPEIKAGGEKLLAQAKEEYRKRQEASDKNIADYSWDAASYIRNKARGMVMVTPCLSEQFRRNYDKIKWR